MRMLTNLYSVVHTFSSAHAEGIDKMNLKNRKTEHAHKRSEHVRKYFNIYLNFFLNKT
jgi:hypothetical protein